MSASAAVARPSAIAAPRIAPVRGGTRCECAACGEVFNGVAAFEAHRVGPFSGELPASAMGSALVQAARDSWQVPATTKAARFRRRCLSKDELAASFERDGRGYWTSR